MTAEVIVNRADMDRDTAIGMTDILSRDGTEITGRDATQNTATGITHRGDTHASTTRIPRPSPEPCRADEEAPEARC